MKTIREIEMMSIIKVTPQYEIHKDKVTGREYMLVLDEDGTVIYSCLVIEKVEL